MSENSQSKYDIAIVGGGLVGATLAALLEPLQRRIVLLDRNEFDAGGIPFRQKQPAFDLRVSALTAASRSLLGKLGVWQAVSTARCCSYEHMLIWDAEGTGSIQFHAADINEPELGTIVENSLLLAALYENLAKFDNLEIRMPFDIERIDWDDGLVLFDRNGDALRSDLVIAADGGNSRVRELAGFRTREWDYQHHAIVTTARTELDHQRTAYQRFIDTGPLAFLPLLPESYETNTDPRPVDQHYSSIVWSAVPDLATELMGLEDQEFKSRLGSAIERQLGGIEWCDRRLSFPLRQRHASDYVKDGIVLVGDAAHTIHPLAGQGVNLGLLDAAVLAEELSYAKEVGRSSTDPIPLQRYQRRRKGHNLSMMWLMEGFKQLFAQQSLSVRWLRNVGMSGVDNLSVIKNQLARRAMGL